MSDKQQEVQQLLNELVPKMPAVLHNLLAMRLDMVERNMFDQTYTTREDFIEAVSDETLEYLRELKSDLAKAQLVTPQLKGQLSLV